MLSSNSLRVSFIASYRIWSRTLASHSQESCSVLKVQYRKLDGWAQLLSFITRTVQCATRHSIQ